MGKEIEVDTNKLEEAASRLSEYADTYTSISKQLMEEATTMGDAWQGEDNLAFVTQIEGFTEELEAMASKIQTSADTLKEQALNYKGRQNIIIDEAKSLKN